MPIDADDLSDLPTLRASIVRLVVTVRAARRPDSERGRAVSRGELLSVGRALLDVAGCVLDALAD